MSASTVVIKNPPVSENYISVKSTLPTSQNSSIIVTTLWIISAVFACARADTSPNGTGVLISLTVQDVIILCISCWLLHKSLCTRNITLAVPWVVVMMYSIYFTHYKGLLKMITTFRHVKISSTLPWVTVGISAVALIIRTVLTFRVLQLSTYLWYRKRLEKELYHQLMD